MAFCANCGSEKAEGAAFCGKCGSAGGAGSAPAYSAPARNTGTVPTMVTLALVFAFLSPLIGLILALVGKKEAEAIGGLAASRNKLATTLSIVFLALGVVFGIIYAVAMGALMANSYSY